ncbi:hypothetical protein [Rhodoferax sp.]|uniref:hypothetical protein n=1 Tax=Rhodoferax sp. TaxID=50421 RepID=UPI00284F185E|nr:hypothetical protein [Rhodoferax sp.]MDR3369006.1 hypothetical protein [Rhodoferax sp.]
MIIQRNFQIVLGVTTLLFLGAAGGAYAGHTLENNQPTQTVDAYKFTVRISDGTYQAFTQTTNVDIRVGDRVQVDNGVLRRY